MSAKHLAPPPSRRIARRAIVLAGCIAGVLAPAAAQAAPVVDVTPTLAANTVAVGDVAQGQLTLSNHSTAPQDAGYLALTELTLVPSCGAQLADPSCVIAPGADPGVITIQSATGSGACTGNGFTVGTPDPVSGKVTFTSAPPVVLSATGASSSCTVSFNYTVNRLPLKDSNTVAAGKQTDLVALAKATASWDGSTVARSGWNTVTVVRDTPELTARASPAVAVGGQLSAAATITGTHPDGTITFNLFGPGDPGCTGAPLSTSAAVANGNGTYQSASVVAGQAGTYRWKTSYAGDEDNDAASTACGAPAAATVVSGAQPPSNPGGPGTTPGGGAGGTTTPGGTGDGGKTGTPGGSAQRIKLDAFSLSRRTFARASTATALAATAAKASKKKKVKKTAKGTTIKYKLSAPATVTILVERLTKGKRSGTKCVKATKKLKAKKSCSHYVKVATLKRVHKTGGAKKVAFSGRAGRKVLAAGSYRLRASATGGAGTTSVTRSATFKIVKK